MNQVDWRDKGVKAVDPEDVLKKQYSLHPNADQMDDFFRTVDRDDSMNTSNMSMIDEADRRDGKIDAYTLNLMKA